MFVIADITSPRSVPLARQAPVPDDKVPLVTILQEGQSPCSMFDDLLKYPWTLERLEYSNPEQLLANFEEEVIQPALTQLERVRREKALTATKAQDQRAVPRCTPDKIREWG